MNKISSSLVPISVVCGDCHSLLLVICALWNTFPWDTFPAYEGERREVEEGEFWCLVRQGSIFVWGSLELWY